VRVGLVVKGGVDRSGRERVIPSLLWLIERLARRHELHVFALDYEPAPCTYSLLGATVHDLGTVLAPPGLRRWAQLHRLNAALDRLEPFDLLHAYWALPAGWAAAIAGRRRSIPVVVTADSGEWVSLPDIHYGLQRRWIDRHAVGETMRLAAAVTVCTQRMARMAGARGVRTQIVPLGVPRSSASAANVPDGPPWRLIHVASINRVKDHATLLHAFARIVAEEPDAHLDVVGEDTLGGEAARLAESLGVASKVTFHGFLPTDAVQQLLATAHLHVVSSRHEAAGVVVLEAAAAGVATVGTRVGYVEDWEPEDQAVAVPPGDAGELARQIVALLRDRDRRDRIAEAAQEWAMAYNADWTATQFDRLYGSIVEKT
jgi:glycosyltransferase involved in cell wall biosynthesis